MNKTLRNSLIGVGILSAPLVIWKLIPRFIRMLITLTLGTWVLLTALAYIKSMVVNFIPNLSEVITGFDALSFAAGIIVTSIVAFFTYGSNK